MATWPACSIRWTCCMALAIGVPGSVGAASSQDNLSTLPLDRFVDATNLELLADIIVTDTKLAQSATSVTQKIVVLHDVDIDRQPVG